ncbi:MAG: hypothetical protein ACR2KV_01380 [Solirubrobacteraceae bacterium]
MRELVAALVLGGIAFVVLAILVKTIAVAIVAAVVVFLLVGFVPRMISRRPRDHVRRPR